MFENICKNSFIAKIFLFSKKNLKSSANYVPDGLYSSNVLFIYFVSGLLFEAFFNQINSLETVTFLSFNSDFTLLHNFIIYSHMYCVGKNPIISPSNRLNKMYRWEFTKSKLGWKSSTKLSNLFYWSISPSLK